MSIFTEGCKDPSDSTQRWEEYECYLTRGVDVSLSKAEVRNNRNDNCFRVSLGGDLILGCLLAYKGDPIATILRSLLKNITKRSIAYGNRPINGHVKKLISSGYDKGTINIIHPSSHPSIF